ncbi:hypothetical protein [Streptomyces sp. BE133]|uniref:hypothetical protein n=1 Tax=Streptomyces sp. BE133 TaxID=3002523 RepID=UPI002E798910|nr:hypothetical protein [Streptomyces sp. BE133]MEE1812701.1 hypothetical protein [Streptomyces sp. BE133]
MDDGPSLGELGRLIQLMRGDIRDDMAQINSRLDRMVSTDVYGVEKAALEREIADVKKDVENVQAQRTADAERVTQTRRWMFASVVIPVLGIIIPIVALLLGGK